MTVHALYKTEPACLEVKLCALEAAQKKHAKLVELRKLPRDIETAKRRADRLALEHESLKGEATTERLSKITCEACMTFARLHPIYWTQLRHADVTSGDSSVPSMADLMKAERAELEKLDQQKRSRAMARELAAAKVVSMAVAQARSRARSRMAVAQARSRARSRSR